MKKSIFSALAMIFFSGLSVANDFPNKQITIIVGVAPGGTLDALARQIAQGLSPIVKQPVVVENVTGAGGLVGIQKLTKSAPDGYTLSFSNMGVLLFPHLYPSANFNTLTDVEPVASVADVPMVLSVSKNSGIKNLSELIEKLKSNKGEVNFGSGGPGTTAHMAQTLFLNLSKTEGTLVQYRGTGPALVDLMSGTIDAVIDQTVTLIPLHDERARAIAISSPERIPQLKDVPTFKEAGLPEFDLKIWNGLLAPKGTPKDVIDKLSSAISKVLDSKEYKERVEDKFASNIPVVGKREPEAFKELMIKDSEKIAKLVKETGLGQSRK